MSAVVKEIPVEIKVGDAEYVLVPNEEVGARFHSHLLRTNATPFYENNVLTS